MKREANNPIPPDGPPNVLECVNCRYTIDDDVVAPNRCPKCNCGVFIRFPRPGSALAQDEQDDEL